MAKLLAIGLTDSGRGSKVNEDTFSCQGKIYPDMISGHEEKSLKTSDYTQLYMITEGYGGPTVGDLSGRVAQALAQEMVDNISAFRGEQLDFHSFVHSFITEADLRIKQQIGNKVSGPSGISLCLLLVDGNEAYVLNVGSTSSFLFRDNELLRLTKPDLEGNNIPSLWLGQDSPLDPESFEPCIRQIGLIPGDIILLAGYSVYSAYASSTLQQEFLSPDAFVGTIRAIHSSSLANLEQANHTTLAIKVQNLDLNGKRPHLPAQDLSNTGQRPFQRPDQDHTLPATETSRPYQEKAAMEYKNGYQSASRAALAAQEYAEARKNMNRPPYNQGRDDFLQIEDEYTQPERENPFGTFFRYLILGFLLGLVVLLLLWIFVI